MIFSNFPCTKYELLHDGANETMTCNTFSVRQIIPESKNLRTATKNINEKENEDFSQGQYFNFDDLILIFSQSFSIIFGLSDVSTSELKTEFRKIFLKASLSQNLQKSGFSSLFQSNFSHINANNFRCNEIDSYL